MSIRRSLGWLSVTVCLAYAGADLRALESNQTSQPQTETQPQAPAPAPVSNSAQPEHRPNFFKQVGGDFKHFPSITTARWLFSGSMATFIALSFDETFNKRFQGTGTGFYNSGKIIGSAAVQAGAGLLAYSVGVASNSKKTSHVGLDIVRGQILAQVLTQATKLAVNRDRPDGTKYSFPSGHASATFASAAILQGHFGWKVGIPAYTVAAYVGFSRLHEDKHFLSDIIFGGALGMAAGRTVGRHGRSVYTWTPVFGPGTGAIMVTRTFSTTPSQP